MPDIGVAVPIDLGMVVGDSLYRRNTIIRLPPRHI
jgi:hypothetical protein